MFPPRSPAAVVVLVVFPFIYELHECTAERNITAGAEKLPTPGMRKRRALDGLSLSLPLISPSRMSFYRARPGKVLHSNYPKHSSFFDPHTLARLYFHIFARGFSYTRARIYVQSALQPGIIPKGGAQQWSFFECTRAAAIPKIENSRATKSRDTTGKAHKAQK